MLALESSWEVTGGFRSALRAEQQEVRCSPAPGEMGTHENLAAFCDCCRLEFEARNQKKEAKELAVLEAMKRLEEEKH